MSKPTVAIFGPSGFLGKPTLEAFESELFAEKFNFPIKVISRKEVPSTDKLQYIKADLSESGAPEIIKAIEGVDVVIELLGYNPPVQGEVAKIVEQVKPKLFIPSQFGCEIPPMQSYVKGFLHGKTEHSEAVRQFGVKVVDIITGWFAVPGAFLYDWPQAAGIDPENKTVTYNGDANTKIAISKLPDIGKVVAAVAATPASELPDTVKVFSEEVSFKEIATKYEQSHNVQLKELPGLSKEEIRKQAGEKIAAGFKMDDFLYYLNAVAAQGYDEGLSYTKNDRELVNPGEKLWKWEKF